MRTIKVSGEVYEKLQRVASQRETSVEAFVSSIAEEEVVDLLCTAQDWRTKLGEL